MKKYSKFTFIVFIVLFVSCNKESKKENLEIINIPKIKGFAEEKYKTSIIDTTHIIQLETNEKSLITSISKVVISDKSVYVYDGTIQRLLEFDLEGSFIRKIGSKGKGPGEYQSMSAFELSESKIIIHNIAERKNIEYNIKDGKFIKSTPIDLRSLELHNFNSNSYIANTHNIIQKGGKKEYSIAFIDKASMKVKPALKSSDKIGRLFDSNSISGRENNEFYYHRPYTYSIFEISKNQKIKEAYKINFGDRSIPNKMYKNSEKIDVEEFDNEIIRKEFVHLSNVYINNGKILLSTVKGNKTDIILHSLDTKKTYSLKNSLDSKLDKLVLINTQNRFIGSKDDFIISYVDPVRVFSEKKEGIFNNKYLRKIDKNDNPILTLTKFKKDI